MIDDILENLILSFVIIAYALCIIICSALPLLSFILACVYTPWWLSLLLFEPVIMAFTLWIGDIMTDME